jgi:hypothetical protein
MLFALGLTQIPLIAVLIIVGWFFELAFRRRWPPENVLLHNGLQILLVFFTFAFAGCLTAAVYQGLVVQPDMQVSGAQSTNSHLNWFVDRLNNELPTPLVVSLPLYIWKLLMLGWSLWLAWSIITWAPWAWRCFSHETLWRRRIKL